MLALAPMDLFTCAEGVAKSDRASAHYKVQDQGDHREDEQQVNQSSGHVENRKSGDPCDQQNYEQNCPDAHVLLLSKLTFKVSRLTRLSAFTGWDVFIPAHE